MTDNPGGSVSKRRKAVAPSGNTIHGAARAEGRRFVLEVRVTNLKTGDQSSGGYYGETVDTCLLTKSDGINLPALAHMLGCMAPGVGKHFEDQRAERLNAQLTEGTVQ